MTVRLTRMRRRRQLKAHLLSLGQELARMGRQLDRLEPPPLKAPQPRQPRTPAPVGRPQIRQARLRLGWTQDQLADAAGLSRVTVSHLEGGRPVASETMRRVLQALRDAGFDVDEEPPDTLQRDDGGA